MQDASDAHHCLQRVASAGISARRGGRQRQDRRRVGRDLLDELTDQPGRRCRPHGGVAGAFDTAQGTAESTEVGGIGVGERRDQQSVHGVVVEGRRVDGGPQDHEQRADRRLLVQRQLVGRDLDRDAGRAQRAAQ